MITVSDYPLLVLLISFALLSFSVWLGTEVFRGKDRLDEDVIEDFGLVLNSSMTLLALLIGFSFSMAISRYDDRKSLEEEEANAIGTEYLRADLLPADDAIKVRALLKDYFDQRILFYTTRDEQHVREINDRTTQLQSKLWSATAAAASGSPSPTVALAAAGMNDVLNSQGYTQASWWNRIPVAAWILMISISIFCHVLVGYSVRRAEAQRTLMLVLPLIMSLAFFLIADIDSPRHGIIRVRPDNLLSIAESLHAP